MAEAAAFDTNIARVIEAIQSGRLDDARESLDRTPALLQARTEGGVSLLMVALYHGRREMAAWIAERRPTLDVFEAAALGDAARLTAVLDGDPSLVHACSADGFTALALAAFFGRANVVTLLLDRGADVNFVSPRPPGYTPLTGAVTGGHTAVVAQLLRRGAHPNHRYGPGYTPLHAACGNGTRDIVEMLLKAGADPHARTDDGKRPGDIAREKGHEDVATLVC